MCGRRQPLENTGVRLWTRLRSRRVCHELEERFLTERRFYSTAPVRLALLLPNYPLGAGLQPTVLARPAEPLAARVQRTVALHTVR